MFNKTTVDLGTGCNTTTDASIADCDFGTRNTPVCDATTDTQDVFYSEFDTPTFKVRPVVFCQASTNRLGEYFTANFTVSVSLLLHLTIITTYEIDHFKRFCKHQSEV